MDDILRNLPKKRLIELRDLRKKYLKEEQEELEQLEKSRQRQAARNAILKP